MKSAIFAHLAVAWAAASCQFNVDGKNYDLAAISGPKSVEYTIDTPPSQRKLEFVLDPCASLKQDKKKPADEQCPDNTIVCGLGYILLPKEKDFILSEVMPFGNGPAPQYQPLKAGEEGDEGMSTSYGNPWGSEKLDVEVHYICSDKEEGPKIENPGLGLNNFYSILWKTPAACATDGSKPKEPVKEPGKTPDNDGESSKENPSWGWFTWLFIIIVLGVAVYIIGNAWINYDRYGNAGVDLLPHADSLRDVPYLIRDLIAKVVGTFTGSSRTGYSAV
ncbi:Autophagy-related protein 27 [Yarrowia sp. C11]|nr:Autophagy-related protein 27 [Yarrowia sp. E02]KAG5371754.1 Autophagy-related protein 27 [Yarrowia sp. C11]